MLSPKVPQVLKMLNFNPTATLILPLPLLHEIPTKSAWVACALKALVIGLPVALLNFHTRRN